MMSKSSFLVNLKENNKRRLWVWAVSVLVFVVLFPTFTALMVDRIVSRAEWFSEIYDEKLVQQIIHEKLIFSMCRTLGFSALIKVMTTGIALISAIQGFSYLYSRKKIDFYMGMPVKRKKRFLHIWLNGILIYVIPYLLGLFISILIAANSGGVDRRVIYEAFTAFYTHILFYLSVYHMAILAVMLTGNIIITGFGFVILCLYEYMVRLVSLGYKELFFQYFSSYGTDVLPVLSPFGMLHTPVKLLLFAVFTGAIAFICYLKRPAEAAGKAMVFEISKPVIKILLIVPTALLAGLFIAEAINYAPENSMNGIGYVIFAMALVVIIGSALMQVIYEFDIKGALHKKPHIVISGVLTALIFIAFRYDLTGYDGYVPNQKKIESVAFVPDYYDTTWGGNAYFDSNGAYMSDLAYADKYMNLSNVEDICELAGLSMEKYDKFRQQVEKEGYSEEQAENWSYATLIYHMKNGRSISRAVWIDVNDDKTIQLLDRIMGTDEFKRGYMPGASENLDRILAEGSTGQKISATCGNSIYLSKMSEADAKEFLEIYRKDLALADFSKVKESTPWLMFSLNVEEDASGNNYDVWNGMTRSSITRTIMMNIYPFYEESITWLKEHGYYMEEQLDPEDVARIQVINYNTRERERLEEKKNTLSGAAIITDDPFMTSESALYDELAVDTRVYVDYTEKDDIVRIADCIYPNEMVSGPDWDGGKGYDGDYEVIVYFNADSKMNREYGINAYYCFMEDDIPDFVVEDTRYGNQ